MNRDSFLFNKVTIVGVGLMGGSLGLALKKYKVAREIIGLSYRHSSLVQALKNGAIDIAFTDVQKAVRAADLVVFATPVETIVKLMPTINKHIRRSCLITDVGSTKAEIVDIAEKIFSVPTNFVGSHPLAGSEKKGAQFASADLYKNSKCILTPTETTSKVTKEKIKHMWMKIGCDVKFMEAHKHDEVLSYISHLPHLLAFALVESIPSEFLEFATQGLKDTTRIAASSPEMWKDICLSNSRNIVKTIDSYVNFLSLYRKAIVDKDGQALINYFKNAKGKRDNV